MGIQNHVIDSSERKNWEKIYNTLVKILLKKKEELQSLASTWKTQHESYIYDVRSYEKQFSQMRNKIKELEMTRVLEVSKLNMFHEFKETELLEETKDVLDRFEPWFDLLDLSENKEDSNCGDGDECRALEGKIRKQKLEFEKLAFGKRCEVSSLLQEAGFAWSQFKHIESGFSKELGEKDKEIKDANRIISSLKDELHSSSNEKDKIIASLQEQLRSSNSAKDKIILSLQEQLRSSNRENSRLEAKVAEMEGKARKNKVKPLRRSPRLNPVLT